MSAMHQDTSPDLKIVATILKDILEVEYVGYVYCTNTEFPIYHGFNRFFLVLLSFRRFYFRYRIPP